MNHLGNVLAIVSDRKHSVDEGHYDPAQGWLSSPDGIADYFEPTILSTHDYYPFGMQMPGRSYETSGYRFGFNGKEADPEAVGAGSQYDYGFRIYNTSIARFLSVDPLTASYPWYTPYQFAGNKPIWAIDLDGKEEFTRTDYYSDGNLYKTEIKMVSSIDAKLGIQVVHHTNVTANNDGTFTKTYIGSTSGSTMGTNAFSTPSSTPGSHEASIANKVKQIALKVDNSGNPIMARLETPKDVTLVSTDLTDGVGTTSTSTVTATHAYLVPGTGQPMQVGYSLMLLDETGNPIGLAIKGGGVAAAGSNSKDCLVYDGGDASTEFTVNATHVPNAYTGTAPANDVSNVNAVPQDARLRGRFVSAVDGIQRYFGTNFKKAQGGSGTEINP